MFLEYFFILKYFFFCFLFVCLLFSVSVLLVYQMPDSEKFSSYECGFNPFGDARNKFEVRFYLVGVLFIIFDLEISFLLPWVMAFSKIDLFGFYAMFYFIFFLSIGFWYE